MQEAPVLVEVIRGETVESRHRGMIAAVTGRGDVIARLGDIDFVSYLRSSAKPFQAIPLMTSGAAAHFGITSRELAVMVGSHGGEEVHVEAASGILAKIGLEAAALKCGIHTPFDRETAARLGSEGVTVLNNNCSGKHAGMLALSRFYQHDWSSYDHPDHPVQVHIKEIIARFADVQPEQVPVGEDGCGVPTFAVSVSGMALMYARFVHPGGAIQDQSLSDACARIVEAMIEFPEMVGATKERLDTELMKLGRGRLIAKIGAEGVYTVGVLPGERYPDGLGLAVKIEDGDDRRVRGMVAVEALKQLQLLSQEDAARLAAWGPRVLTNHRGDTVGQIRPRFQLEIDSQL